MFGRATIRLGIGPHSSFNYLIETKELLKVTDNHIPFYTAEVVISQKRCKTEILLPYTKMK